MGHKTSGPDKMKNKKAGQRLQHKKKNAGQNFTS